MSSAYERALLMMSCLAPYSDRHCLIHMGADTPPRIISQEGTQQPGPFSVLDDNVDFDNCLLFGLFHVQAKDTMPDMRAVKGCLQLQDLKVRPFVAIRKMVTKLLEPATSRITRGAISNIYDATPDWVQGLSPELDVSGRDSAVLDMNFLSPAIGLYDGKLYPWFVLLFRQFYWLRHMLLVQIQISDASIEHIKTGMERYYPEKEGMQGSYEEAADSLYQLVFQGMLEYVPETIAKLKRDLDLFDVPSLLRSLSLYSARTDMMEPVRATTVIEHADVGLLRSGAPERFSCIINQLDVAVNEGSDNPDVQYVFDMIKNRAASLGSVRKE